ncbi:delta-aminolevulinic acid dehydratase [Candidatus Kuenenia stuttgartiensis]|nr:MULTISPECIES: porphobilinogen synthase [Kuenenia]MBE7546225.1 porphobilinogen synthase [Planctomycetia bacterium]MCZ7554666.1 porphobilinogen synthase [Anaerolineales bacterium]MBW7940998.1 porphobilinogen synthase [Candidatus Kuenenia stuttgartiensis]MBZ0192628.1 porphobilinogen synthase [Candidatus Kuenenia stuttgartiensis]MCF6152984.1 porphobilinogen synthase [Candidatus Kuenenia stuttgartiensis]
MSFPKQRLRRLRQNENIRRLVRETHLSVDDLIMPLFVRPGKGIKQPIPSMPGNYQMSVDILTEEVKELEAIGIPGIILFGIPEVKDELGSDAYSDAGIIQKAITAIKKEARDILVLTDVCMCEYTSHGHCGFLKADEHTGHFEIDNDKTLELLAKEAVSHANAGADIIAPSDMMDGRIGTIREALDREGFRQIPIMAYSAKYASGFYGPFREAAESTPEMGDRSSYQMDSHNAVEALREVSLDIEEGADIVMVKPALAYLDIIRNLKENFNYPIAAYNVSGEFSIVKAAAEKGWIDEKRVALEILTAIKRAGADIILTYWAKDAARWLKE